MIGEERPVRALGWIFPPSFLRKGEKHRLRKVSPSLIARIQDLLNHDAVERSKGSVYINRLFEVPKRVSQNTRLVLDVSLLNLHIPTC